MFASKLFQSLNGTNGKWLLIAGLFIVFGVKLAATECGDAAINYQLYTSQGNNTTIGNITFTEVELEESCSLAFFELLTGKECHEESTTKAPPTTAERYGYGFLAVTIVTLLPLLGFAMLPLLNKVVLQYILVGFTGLAVSTLLTDVAFHLIPITLGLHNHANENSHGSAHSGHGEESSSSSRVTVPDYQWRMFLSVFMLYGFFLLEVTLKSITQYLTGQKLGDMMPSNHGHSHGGEPVENFDVSATKSETTQKKSPYPGYMVLVGDGIHNLADGLAIGAAFTQNLLLGWTTMVAVTCHELPHELGDYAVLLESGFSPIKAVLWNLLSAVTAVIGFFIGASVSTDQTTRQWIFALTIGMFLYIALVDLLPTLLNYGFYQWKKLICIIVGLLIGTLIMFLLAIYEDKLIQSSK